jgi:hypothetical protein
MDIRAPIRGKRINRQRTVAMHKQIMDIRGMVRPEVLAQKAYAVDSAPCRIKLDAN